MEPNRYRTVGELKAALSGLDDSTPIVVERGDWSADVEAPEVYLADSGHLVIQHPFAD